MKQMHKNAFKDLSTDTKSLGLNIGKKKINDNI